MEELRALLTNPVWWISAVVVALLMNVIASYVVRGLDRTIGKSSRKWRERQAREREKFETLVKYWANDPEGVSHLVALEMRSRTKEVLWVIFLGFALVTALLDALFEGLSGVEVPKVLTIANGFATLVFTINFIQQALSAESARKLLEAVRERRLAKTPSSKD